ncbi:MAG: hypothetical protein GY777_24500 [Candidatus Brocadiaceae bacterium]|nr:hypothetical protein [Candidatus Brocadiaceae bacterium]
MYKEKTFNNCQLLETEECEWNHDSLYVKPLINVIDNKDEWNEQLVSQANKLFCKKCEEFKPYEIKLEGYTDKRSIITNPIFSDGFAVGWKFAVPEVFKAALDIKLTTRKKKEKSLSVFTQGTNYSFSAYDTIYDTPKAYKIWNEALKEFHYCIEIQEAIPCKIIQTKEFKTEHPTSFFEDGKKSDKKKVLVLKRTRTSNGYVKFKLLKPDKAKKKLKLHGIYETDQEKFVLFLQTGRLITNNNDIIEFKY